MKTLESIEVVSRSKTSAEAYKGLSALLGPRLSIGSLCPAPHSASKPVMQASRRKLLIVGLAATAGALDSWSYFGLAHIFIANMTGNTVLLGFALASGQWNSAAGTAAAILCYLSGVFLGALLAGPIREAVRQAESHAEQQAEASLHSGPTSVLWPARVNTILLCELVLLVLAASRELIHTPATGSLAAHILIGLGAVAIGLQSAAVLALKLPGVVTTYITGTWTTLATGLAQGLVAEEAPAKSSGKEPVERLSRQLRLQAAVVLTYCAAAACSGLLMRSFGRGILGWLSVAILGTVLVGGLSFGRRRKA